MSSDNFTVKDSGKRRSFETGSVRDDASGKPRLDLASPFVDARMGQHRRKGSEKYNDWNWALGQKNSVLLASTERHLNAFKSGKLDEDHLAAAIWNLEGIMHNQEVAGKGIKLNYGGETYELSEDLLDIPVFTQPTKEDDK